jgi:hypothetical protein
VAIHAFLLPESYKVVIAGRNLPKQGPMSVPEPGVGGNVSTIYDVKTGTYTVAVNYETLFCTAHTHVSDGNIVAAGGDMGEWHQRWCLQCHTSLCQPGQWNFDGDLTPLCPVAQDCCSSDAVQDRCSLARPSNDCVCGIDWRLCL